MDAAAQHEFDQGQNVLIGALAKKMLWVAYFSIGAGLLLVVAGVVSIADGGLVALIEAPFLVIIGVWTKKAAAIKGSWRIVEDNGRLYLELDEDFKTKKAPDLKVFLSPRPLSDLDGATAPQGAALIGALSSHKGKQRLAVPASIKLGDFRTLIIHCEKYDKLWGGANLK